MARIRTIKPDFFTSEDIVSRSPLARLLYIATWLEADRAGRFVWKPKTLKLRYLPGDDCDIEAVAKELIDAGLIIPYDVDGQQFAEIPSFTRHQVINNRETASEIPARKADATLTRAPRDGDACPTRDDATGTPLVGREGKGKEGKGSRPVPDGTGCRQPAADNDNTDAKKREFCPYQQIINAYHAHFPSGPQVSKLTDKRKRSIAARWNEVRKGEYRPAGQPQAPRDQDKALHFFERYFTYCESLPWCTGRQPMKDGKLFRATIDNLVGAEFMAKRSDAAHDAREAA